MTESAERTEIVFLGIAERSSLVRDGDSPFLKWNILGLRTIVFFNFFPANLSGLNFAFAFRHLTTTDLKLRLVTEAHEELGFINVGATSHDPLSPGPPGTATREHLTGFQLPEGWVVFIFPLGITSLMLPAAGRYFITHPRGNGNERSSVNL